MAYLLGERDAAGLERSHVAVLRGDPQLVADLADSRNQVWRYSAGVIAWHRDDRPTDAQIRAVLDDAANDLFVILANREHRLPTLIASQWGPGYWVEALPDRVAADSIVNRLANNARTINLGSIDMRKLRNDRARTTADHWE